MRGQKSQKLDDVIYGWPHISYLIIIIKKDYCYLQSRYGVTMILIANVGAMVVFSFLAPFRADAAKSKPLVGFSGLFSACLATLAGFGFCCYIGVEWISLNLAAPFLLFGIGFDDTFVVLSAWSRSQSHLSVSERMGKTFADAGVSITFTSLTNICR